MRHQPAPYTDEYDQLIARIDDLIDTLPGDMPEDLNERNAYIAMQLDTRNITSGRFLLNRLNQRIYMETQQVAEAAESEEEAAEDEEETETDDDEAKRKAAREAAAKARADTLRRTRDSLRGLPFFEGMWRDVSTTWNSLPQPVRYAIPLGLIGGTIISAWKGGWKGLKRFAMTVAAGTGLLSAILWGKQFLGRVRAGQQKQQKEAQEARKNKPGIGKGYSGTEKPGVAKDSAPPGKAGTAKATKGAKAKSSAKIKKGSPPPGSAQKGEVAKKSKEYPPLSPSINLNFLSGELQRFSLNGNRYGMRVERNGTFHVQVNGGPVRRWVFVGTTASTRGTTMEISQLQWVGSQNQLIATATIRNPDGSPWRSVNNRTIEYNLKAITTRINRFAITSNRYDHGYGLLGVSHIVQP